MSEPDKPVRWGRWIGIAFLLLLVGLILFHTIWGAVASRRLQAQIAQLRASGEPVLPADFKVANADGPDNAGPDIMAAAKMLDDKSPQYDEFYKLNLGFPLRPRERTVVAAEVQMAEQAMKRIEAASGKTRFDWNVNLQPALINHLLPNLSGPRNVAMVLMGAVVFEHDRLNDRAAVRHLQEILFVSHYPDKHPSLVGHLVGIGVSVLAANWAAQISPDLSIGEGATQASPQEVRHLIDLLLDPKPTDDGLLLSLRGERMFEIEMIQSLSNGTPVALTSQNPLPLNSFGRYALRPLLLRNAGTAVNHATATIAASREKNWPDAKSKLPKPPDGASLMNIFARMFVPALGRVLDTHYRGLTDRRLAAIILALRWYTLEHDGQLPQTLDELMPRYLPAVPKDAMAAGDAPLHYQPRKEDPIVYSVGSDGIDDGGSEQSSFPKRKNVGDWDMKDRVQHLNRQPRPPAEEDEESPATAPATAP